MAVEITYYVDAWARKLGLRNVDIVNKAKITPGYISSLRSGRRKRLSPEMEAELAIMAFGIPVEALRYHPDSDQAKYLLAMQKVGKADFPTALKMLGGIKAE